MNAYGTLYVVATPIGNLADLSVRAQEILRSVDWVAAEDTRHSGQLLKHINSQAKLVPLHEHNEQQASPGLIVALQAGKHIALISDAGTPAISDPGALLVAQAHAAGVRVEPIPGANAAVCALSAAGLINPGWLFYGFLPARDAARQTVLEQLVDLPWPLVFYEAPHRILASVAALHAVLGERRLLVARELTKRYESIHALPLSEAVAWLSADAQRQKGEFVLVVSPAPPVIKQETDELRRILSVLMEELPLRQAVHLATRLTGIKKNLCYDLALQLKAEPWPILPL